MLQYTFLYKVPQVATYRTGLYSKFLVECIPPPQWDLANDEPQGNYYGLQGRLYDNDYVQTHEKHNNDMRTCTIGA